jgi:hypothetical protein
MLVTSCWHHQAKGKGILDLYSTLPTENLLKIKYTVKHGFNGYDKGLNQEMVTTTGAVTSTMQIVEYHVEYNTTTDQTHLKQTTLVVGSKVTPRKKGLPL